MESKQKSDGKHMLNRRGHTNYFFNHVSLTNAVIVAAIVISGVIGCVSAAFVFSGVIGCCVPTAFVFSGVIGCCVSASSVFCCVSTPLQ